MWLQAVDFIKQLVSHIGSDTERFIDTDTAVGVASTLQVERPTDNASICRKSKSFTSS